MAVYYTYMVVCKDCTLYTGYTNDLVRRQIYQKPFAGALGLLGEVCQQAAGYAAGICHQAMDAPAKAAVAIAAAATANSYCGKTK